METDEASAWRWTDGAATLAPTEPSMLEVALRMVAPSWKRPAAKLRLVQAG